MRATRNAMSILRDTPTPTGEDGILIECTCASHPQGKTRAILRAGAREGLETHPERIHGNVLAAWHPLAGAASIQARGSWRA